MDVATDTTEPDGDLQAPSALLEAQDRFVALWGQMGSNWGIPRGMAEVHALLYITNRPMNTDAVMAALSISRGNASTSLRGLVDWGVVHRVHQPGDRKEYFSAEQDVWRLFRTVLQERKRREVDPLLEALHDCRELSEDGAATEDRTAVADHQARVDQLIEFVHIIDAISQRFIGPTGQGLQKAARLLGRAS